MSIKNCFDDIDFHKLELSDAFIEMRMRESGKLYRKNPSRFEVPKFAIKVY